MAIPTKKKKDETLKDITAAPMVDAAPTKVTVPSVDLPKATVATKDSPIINRGAVDTPVVANAPVVGKDETGAPDIRVDKIGEVLSDEEKTSIFNDEQNKIRQEEGLSMEERNKKVRQLRDDLQSGNLFGGETMLEMERVKAEREEVRLGKRADKALASAESIIAEELAIETNRIKDAGKRVMDTTQRLNSLRGAGRSSANEEIITRQQGEINGLISVAEDNADIKLKLRQANIEGATSEAITALRDSLRANEEVLGQRMAEATKIQAELDATIGASFTDSAGNLVQVLAAGGTDIGDYDEKASEAFGYISDAKGRPLALNTEGNPVAPKNEYGMDAKITNFKDANDNTYVYTNGELTSIIQRNGEILKDTQLDTANVPAQVEEDKTAKIRRDNETALRNEFIKRPEVKRFQEIRAQFERVKQGANANNASGDIALVFSFMKMLDPGSVVRESEFATAQNAAGVSDKIRNLYNKVLSGTRLGSEQRGEFRDTAENLLKSEVSIFEDVKEGFSTIIKDAGARPEFVIIGEEFDAQGNASIKLEESESQEIDNIFGAESSGSGEITTSSGKTFSIDFNKEDQTSSNKGGDLLGFIKNKEGFRAKAYDDATGKTLAPGEIAQGVATIGYGATKIDGKPVTAGQNITEEDASTIFNIDVERHSNFKNVVTVPLSESQKTALASFEFNLGPNIWKSTGKDIVDAINRGDIKTAQDIMIKHNKAKDSSGKLQKSRGLTNRRKEEAKLLEIIS